MSGRLSEFKLWGKSVGVQQASLLQCLLLKQCVIRVRCHAKRCHGSSPTALFFPPSTGMEMYKCLVRVLDGSYSCCSWHGGSVKEIKGVPCFCVGLCQCDWAIWHRSGMMRPMRTAVSLQKFCLVFVYHLPHWVVTATSLRAVGWVGMEMECASIVWEMGFMSHIHVVGPPASLLSTVLFLCKLFPKCSVQTTRSPWHVYAVALMTIDIFLVKQSLVLLIWRTTR